MSTVFESTGVQPLILELLGRRTRFEPKQLEELGDHIEKSGPGTAPEAFLIKGGYLGDQEIANIYAEDLFLPLVPPLAEGTAIDKELAGLLPEKLCIDRLICPMACAMTCSMSPSSLPRTWASCDELQLLTGLRINPLIAPFPLSSRYLDALYRANRDSKAIGEGADDFEDAEDQQDDWTRTSSTSTRRLPMTRTAASSAWSIRFSSRRCATAPATSTLSHLRMAANFDCASTACCTSSRSPSKSIFIMIVSRFKVLAKMDIAEKRIPQDGAIALRTGDTRIDLRVNTVPTVHGEKMVMRILDKGAIPLDLTGLGLDERQSNDLIESIQSPYGLALVTGPTGSGKSTTLYSCLNQLNEPKVNICTVEDPVEYKFKGMNQVQVKAQVGLTFSSALAGFLAARPRHHHGRRGPRPGDRRNLSPGGVDRPLRALHDPYQRRSLGRDPASGYGHRAVLAFVRPARARGPAAGPPALSQLQRAV